MFCRDTFALVHSGIVDIQGSGVSVPFEVKGGSPIVLHVEHHGSTYELRVVPTVVDVRFLPGIANAIDVSLPAFGLQLNLPVSTRKL